MCGVFGFVADGGGQCDLEFLEHVARDTEKRGPHAFGFAWVDSRQRLRMFKQQGRVTSDLGLLRMTQDARMLIGHCRYATHGDPSNNLNNHPHPCDGGWLVHNGVIGSHAEINEGYRLHPVTECDSETLALLVEELDGTLVERCAKAIDECATSPLSTMALWRNPTRMIAARAGNPLSWVRYDEGYYLASNRSAVPQGTSIPDRTALSFSIRGGETRVLQYSLDEVVEASV